MPEISKIRLENIEYDIKDEELRRQLSILIGSESAQDDTQVDTAEQ